MLIRHSALFKSTARCFSQYQNAWYAKSKPKPKMIAKYEAIPHSLDIEPKDPFDYPLRSKQSVEEYLKDRPKRIPFKFEYEFNFIKGKNQGPIDRYVKGWFKVGDLDLTPKQRERLIFLCHDRYNKKTDIVKIRVDGLPTKEENMMRLEEIMEELYLETLRAP